MGSGMKIVITFGVIIGGVVLGVVIFLNSNIINGHRESRDEKKERIERELRQMAEKHLESKYGERFVLEQHWYGTGSGSPFPGVGGGTAIGDPTYCYASAESDMDFRFHVYVYPELLEQKLSINNVKEIQDGYCWKFIKEKMKEEMQEKLGKILDREYKLFIRTSGDDFNSQLTSNSTVEDYLRLAKFSPNIQCFIFVKVSNDESEKKIQKYFLQLIAHFKKIENEFEISFDYYIVNNNDDFDSIDVVKEENGHFAGHDRKGETWQNPIWDLKMKRKFGIEIDTRTGKETIYNFSNDDLEDYNDLEEINNEYD